MAIANDDGIEKTPDQQTKLSAMQTCGAFLCKHWTSLTAVLVLAAGGNPALPVSLFFLSIGVANSPNVKNEVLKGAAIGVMVTSALVGMFSSIAALPRFELEYPPNSEEGLNRKAYETLMTPLFYVGKYPSFSASFFLNLKAVENVKQRIQDGEDSPLYKNETGMNWWRWGHFAPVQETVHVDGAKICRNKDNTQVLMEVDGNIYGYTRPTNKAAWRQVDLKDFPYAEACRM